MVSVDSLSRYPESRLSLEVSAETGGRLALEKVAERFEDPTTAPELLHDPATLPKDKVFDTGFLPYHNQDHTNGVINRTQLIIEVMATAQGFSNAEKIKLKALAGLIAANHDTVQKWVVNEVATPDGSKLMRKRLVKQNEQVSADELIAWMKKQNLNSRSGNIYSEADISLVSEAILATVPSFSPEKSTVIQPNVTAETSLTAQAVALADLGEAGMGKPDDFIVGGDRLFLEENLDIEYALYAKKSLTNEQKISFRNRMLGWTEFQSKFVTGRKELLDQELARLPENIASAIKELFGSFDDTLEKVSSVVEARKKMTFEELVTDMKFDKIFMAEADGIEESGLAAAA